MSDDLVPGMSAIRSLALTNADSEQSRGFMADQAAQIAKAFTDHYYTTFDSNRANVTPLYSDQAVLTFNDNTPVIGQQAVSQKLGALPFQQVKHHVKTVDAHPSPSGGILILVTGSLQTEPTGPHLMFSEAFHLVPAGSSFQVTNDAFRLVMQ